MAVTIIQTPNLPFDQAYGANPITLEGIPVNPVTGITAADKYVLQIWRSGNLIADFRQSSNEVGKAIFDIQQTLQNFVAPSAYNIEETGYFGNEIRNSAEESTPFQLKAGYELNGGVIINSEPAQVFLDFGGTKAYYEVPYNATPYIPLLSTGGTGGCTIIDEQAQPFTDMQNFRLAGSITDGKPNWLLNNMRVYDHYVTVNDMTTISYYNGVRGTGPLLAKSIEAFEFYQYSGNTLLTQDVYLNIQSTGGGPNTTPGQGLIPVYPVSGLTLGTGPKNFQDFDSINCTHYYVSTLANDPCSEDYPSLTDDSMHYVHRFNIIGSNCLDFPEYQFSWLNSFGFRDYYSFSKRKDRRVSIKRNEFLKEAADYASGSYSVNQSQRGTTVYSQELQQEFSAFTDYLSDEDALFLEKLFISADVKVRFDDAPGSQRYKWVPVSLLSSAYEEKTYRKNKLFQYEIRFKIAHNIKSQRG